MRRTSSFGELLLDNEVTLDPTWEAKEGVYELEAE
jgi:hypothetical protein